MRAATCIDCPPPPNAMIHQSSERHEESTLHDDTRPTHTTSASATHEDAHTTNTCHDAPRGGDVSPAVAPPSGDASVARDDDTLMPDDDDTPTPGDAVITIEMQVTPSPTHHSETCSRVV